MPGLEVSGWRVVNHCTSARAMQRWARDTVHRAFMHLAALDSLLAWSQWPPRHGCPLSKCFFVPGRWHKLQPFITVPLTLVKQRHCGVVRSSLENVPLYVCEIYTYIYFIHINIYKHRCGLIICEYIFAYINSYNILHIYISINIILNKYICCKDKYIHWKYLYIKLNT